MTEQQAINWYSAEARENETHKDARVPKDESVKKHFADNNIPIHASIVMESSSVWYDTYRFLTDELGYKNVTLSNPYLTKAIAASKKKTILF